MASVQLMISIEKLTYRYPGQDKPALNKIDMEIPEGQFVGIIGPSGAGKSTLCYALAGFVPHFFHGTMAGEVHIGKRDVAHSTLGELAGEVGLVFQNPFNQISGARFTVREEVAFGLENLGLPRKEMQHRLDETLDLIGLTEVADRSPFALSGGQQQRVAIASILAMQPRLLILDEPTSQLDPRSTQDVFAILEKLAKRGGTTVVIVEQKLEWLATFTDRVVVLSAGKLVMDSNPEEIMADPRLNRLGIGQTQYSLAAESAKKKKLVAKTKRIPVSLKDSVKFFS
jgi:energy-coupling factor transporter ATP-binding protein EcfA2